MISRLLFSLRLRFGQNWTRSYWVPSKAELTIGLIALTLSIAVFLLVTLTTVKAAHAIEQSRADEAQQMFQDCIDGKAVIQVGDVAMRCRKPEWIPV